MKLTIRKKGVVDCTSDSRTHDMETIRDGINGAIKIVDKEVLSLRYAKFYVKNDCKLAEYRIKDKIEVTDKTVCLKLLNYFKENASELSEDYTFPIHVHVKIWNFFGDGDNCSDFIEINNKYLEVSCQDNYDPDMREEFHDMIEQLIGSDYSIVMDNDKLISLHICTTEKCSANCEICYVNRGLKRELEKEDWVKLPLADQYALGGGEPAEYPLIAELVDYLKNDRKGYVAITTNGQKLIDFNTLPDKIAISIDGLTNKEHIRTHATDLNIAKSTAESYKDKGIKICINHIVHKHNIDKVKIFAKHWLSREYEINFILYTGNDNDKYGLRPTYEQLQQFKDFFDGTHNQNVMIDSCMGGLLTLIGSSRYKCSQGLFSKYYKYGTTIPCSHSAKAYPECSVMEEYFVHYFKTLRPLIFIYDKDATSGAHEWAFKSGYQGKIVHNVDKPLRKDVIYIMTDEEEIPIKEQHYTAYFKNKMPFWLESKMKIS